MAYLMRKIAVIGFIAMNSPLLGAHSPDVPAAPMAHRSATIPSTEARTGAGGFTAAREAAQILAALDPAMRDRVLGAAASFTGAPTSSRAAARAP